MHTLQSEIARTHGKFVASALLDIVKAFEYIKLSDVWAAGVASNFNLRVLRVLLRLYEGPRRMLVGKAVQVKPAPGKPSFQGASSQRIACAWFCCRC